MTVPIAIGAVGGAAILAFLLLTLVRRAIGGPLLREPTRGTPMTMIVGTSFAVLLAFVTIAAFQTYNGAKTGARTEAVALLEMFRTAALFAVPDRDALRADFVCYGRAVSVDEWHAMRNGRRSALPDHWIETYRATFNQLALSSPREQAGFEELLAEARNRTDGRRERLTEDTSSVPLPLWLVLILGGCAAVALQLSMADPREHLAVQGTMIAAVAAVVTAGLLLVNFLDHPYKQHTGSVQPVELRQSLVMMHNQAPGLTTPCRVDGRPR